MEGSRGISVGAVANLLHLTRAMRERNVTAAAFGQPQLHLPSWTDIFVCNADGPGRKAG